MVAPAPSFQKDQIVIGGTGSIWVAPVGTPMPAHDDSTFNAAFKSLGYTNEDGVQFNDSKEMGEFRPWQSFYAARRWVISRSGEVTFTMAEWDAKTIPLGFGGGTIAEPSPGHFVYHPPAPETVDERAMVVRILDGAYVWQIGIPRGMVTSGAQSTFARSGPALLPITFGINGEDTGEPWTLASNHPALQLALAGS